MAEKSREVVRHPIRVNPQSRRRLDERIYVHFPGVASVVGAAVFRLPSHSRLRQAVIRRAVRTGIEALNRGDFKAVFSSYHSQAEFIPGARLAGVGFDSSYRGREERIRFQQRWVSEWGDFRFVPEEVIDFGEDRIFVTGRVVGSGLSSGAGFDNFWAALLTMSAGRVIREQPFFDRAEALQAVGLSEERTRSSGLPPLRATRSGLRCLVLLI